MDASKKYKTLLLGEKMLSSSYPKTYMEDTFATLTTEKNNVSRGRETQEEEQEGSEVDVPTEDVKRITFEI